MAPAARMLRARVLVSLAVLLGLSGCAGLGPLDEKERARIRVVAPVAARFPPKIDFRLPPGKGETAALAGVDSALRAGQVCLYTGPFLAACLAAFGAALTPSTEKLELSAVERVHTEFRASDVQQFLAQRYSERVTRLTSLTVDPGATNHGPKSPEDIPSYGSVVLGENTVVAEVVVSWMNGSLEKDGEVWWLNISLQARMRLVRPTDGTTLSTRVYRVHRRGRPLQDYQQGGARPLQAITGAIDAAATLMVDDAFLLHSAGDVPELAVTPLEPLRGTWSHFPQRLETISPKFRWKPFPEPQHLEIAPWLRTARNLVYDLWVVGGDDDRIVEGLTTTEHVLERPLLPCMYYSWAVRARFDTEAGPRAVEWSKAGQPRIAQPIPVLLETWSGASMRTPCPTETNENRSRDGK